MSLCSQSSPLHPSPQATADLSWWISFMCSRVLYKWNCMICILFVSGFLAQPWLLVFSCLSSFGSSRVPYVLPSLMNPGIVVDFSVCSVFYLLLEWNSESQVPYMQKQKPKVLPWRSWLSTSPSAPKRNHCCAYSHCTSMVFFLNWII